MFRAGAAPPGTVGLLGKLHDGRHVRRGLGLGPRERMGISVPGQHPAVTGERILTLPDADASMSRRVGLGRGRAGRLRQAHPGGQRSDEGSGQYLGPVAWDFQRHEDARDDSGGFFFVDVIHVLSCWLVLCFNGANMMTQIRPQHGRRGLIGKSGWIYYLTRFLKAWRASLT